MRVKFSPFSNKTKHGTLTQFSCFFFFYLSLYFFNLSVNSVDALTSPKTRLPYDYYDFPFCRPEKGVIAAGETLGEIFAGARMESTSYNIQMNTNFKCKVLCEKILKKEEILKLKKLVDDQYVVNLMVDNLPGKRCIICLFVVGGGLLFVDCFSST